MACYRIIKWEPWMVAVAVRMRFNAIPPVPWEVVGMTLRISGGAVRYRFNKHHRELCLELDRRRTERIRKLRPKKRRRPLTAARTGVRGKKIRKPVKQERLFSPRGGNKELIPYAGSKYCE